MSVPPITVQHMFAYYNSADAFLKAAAEEKDPAKQQSLASVGHGYAALAQASATWFSYTDAQSHH